MEFEIAEVVLEKMGADWVKWRQMPRHYKAKAIATQRVLRMVEAAKTHDEMMRAKLKEKER